MRNEIPEEPARRGSNTSASLCLDGLTEKYGCMIPRTKSARPRNSRKSWQHFEHLRTTMARTGRYEEETLQKAVVGANRPRAVLYDVCMEVMKPEPWWMRTRDNFTGTI